MAIVVCHSPKGGAGTTFVAAQLALHHAAAGRSITLLSTMPSADCALHCGRVPTVFVPALNDRRVVGVPGTVDLRRHDAAASDPDLIALVIDLGFTAPGDDRHLIVDVGAGQQALVARLATLATLRLYIITAAPDALASLPELSGGAGETRDAFVLNAFDETRRIERHGAALARELLGERLIGRIRRDVGVIEAIAAMQPLSVHAPASAALADVRAVAGVVAARLADRGGGADVLQLPTSAILAA